MARPAGSRRWMAKPPWGSTRLRRKPAWSVASSTSAQCARAALSRKQLCISSRSRSGSFRLFEYDAISSSRAVGLMALADIEQDAEWHLVGTSVERSASDVAIRVRRGQLEKARSARRLCASRQRSMVSAGVAQQRRLGRQVRQGLGIVEARIACSSRHNGRRPRRRLQSKPEKSEASRIREDRERRSTTLPLL